MYSPRRKFLRKAFWGGVLLSTYPIFIERYLVEVNRYQIKVPNLPKEFDGFTIVHLSDLHYGFLVPQSFIEKVVNLANSINGDIIVSTGDFVHAKNTKKEIDIVWPIVSKLKAKDGVYSVLGNHDHWADLERSMYWMKRSGQDLRHKTVEIKRENSSIFLGGVGDLWCDRVNIDKTFKNIEPTACKICLAHNPDSADLNFKTNIDLMLCGHTHGGQVKIPFFGAPILPVKNKKYSQGFIESDNTNLFISRGVGWAVLPVRFNCFPEIAVLEIRS